MALTQGLIDSYWQKYNQRRALTGLPSGYQEQRGMLDPMLEYGLRDAQAQRDYALRVQAQDMARQQMNDQARAATVSGIAQVGGMLGTGYLGYKSITGSNATNQRLLDIMASKQAPVTTTPEIPGKGMFEGPNPWSTPGAGSSGLLSPAGVGGGVPLQSAINPATAAPFSYSTSGIAGTMGEGLGAGGTAAGSAIPLAAAAPVVAAGMAGNYLAGKALTPFAEKIGMPYTAKGLQYGGFLGATAGAGLDALKGLGSFASDVFGW